MIRRRQLIADCSSWTPPDLSDPYTLEAAWQEWRVHEMVKRFAPVSFKVIASLKFPLPRQRSHCVLRARCRALRFLLVGSGL